MSVLDRAALQASPLADLHAIASELSIDSYRRLRRAELIDAIVARQAGAPSAPVPAEEPSDDVQPADDDRAAEQEQAAPRRRRGRRAGRARAGGREEPAQGEDGRVADAPVAEESREADEEAAATAQKASAPAEDVIVEGAVELMPNGSGFVRTSPEGQSDDDVYISAAQVRRCELVSGDRVSGPRRAPRRSERFASLIRVDTINGRPVAEIAGSTRFDDLPAAFPTEQIRLATPDVTINAIESVAPFGRGSRVTIVGPFGAGKSEALNRLAAALATQEDLQVSVALAGIRPEEIGEWNRGPTPPAAAAALGSSADAQAHAVELVVDQGRRMAARGADAVVMIDSLDGLHEHAAVNALAAARNIVGGGSLTVIATSSRPRGGETTIITLDRALTRAGRFPAVDVTASGTIRSDLLVGDPRPQEP